MWCCVMSALLMSICCAAICEVMNGLIGFGAGKSVTLTEKNSPKVLGIPGEYDVNITWYHYLYNVTNLDDVVFRNEKPTYEEFGPFVY